MKTIQTNVYQFSELSNEAKEIAINEFRNEGIDTSFIYDDAYKTVKQFHEIFGTKEGNNSWLDVRCNNFEDNVCNLTGIRLRTYIINNFGSQLYKGKYYSLWSKTEKSYKHYTEGYPVLKTRYSKCIFWHSCVLTGMCYDESLLQPIYEFIENYKEKSDYYSYMDIETLMNDCFESLTKDVESEVDAQSSDECIIDTLEANDYEFTEDGKRY